MKDISKVVIAGAGPGGLTAALALRDRGVDVRIFERVDREHMLADVGGAYDLSPHVFEAMDDLGVGEALRKDASHISALKTFSSSGEEIGTLTIPDSIDTVSLRRSVLQRRLLHTFGVERVTASAKVIGYREDEAGVTVELEGGQTHRADVLIGADGIHSMVRAGVLGEQPAHFCSCMCSWGRVSDTEFAQLAELPADGVTWFGRGACFILGHLDGLIIWSAFWHADEYARSASRAATKALILDRFAEYPDFVRALIESTPDDTLAETGIWDRDPSPGWTKGRVALLGDAAHPTTPFLGQGANSAITDGYVLGSYLSGMPYAEAFELYEQRRMKVVAKNVKTARRIGEMMTGDRWWSSLATRVLFGWLPDQWLVKGILTADEANDMRDLIEAHRDDGRSAVTSGRWARARDTTGAPPT
ncbi:MAG: FAD-dependent monooxygenase [Kofleriaceae bacterium]